MNFSFWLWAALRAALIGVVVVGVSLPLVFALHGQLELGAPPAKGLWALGLGDIGAFVGAAWIGLGVGRARGSGTLAALGGFMWGALLCLWLASYYGGLVSRAALREADIVATEHREHLAQNPDESEEQARAGHASKDAALAGLDLSDDARDAAIGGAAKLPAMPLLVWAILLPPALSALECRRARRSLTR